MAKKLEVISVLEQEFPRIAQKIVDLWGGPEVNRYLRALVFDERGDRHGFPFDAASELMLLEYISNSETGDYDQSVEAKVLNNPQFGMDRR